MALPPLLVKIGADTKDLDKGLDASAASLLKFAKVGAAAGAAVGAAMVALTKASLDNIDVLAKQARSLGLTTAAFQKMSLVAGEAGVEAGRLSSMLGLMQRNIIELQNGTQMQVDTFRALGVSLVELQGLSPDEQFQKIAESLSAITDPAEKTALAMEVFGRSGRDAINMLDGYADAARNADEFQRRFGITVGQEVSTNVERANDAVGRLGQVFTGLGNQMAGAVAPSIERVANGLIDLAANIIGIKVRLDEFFDSLEQARVLLGEDVYNALVNNTEAIADNADAIEQIRRAYGGVAPVLLRAQTDLENFADELGRVGEIGAEEVLNGLVQEMSDLQRKFLDGKISGEEYNDELQRISTRAENLVTQLQDINGVGFQAAIESIGGLRTALGQALSTAMALRANLPGAEMTTTGTGLTAEDGNLLPPSLLAPTTSVRPMSREEGRFDEFFGPADAAAGGGGGKSDEDRLREKFARRLEVLMEGLMTERETVAEWYNESLALIEQATDAELQALGGKHEAMERLEKEHQERLSRIRELGAAADLHTLLGAGKEVLTAMGSHNKKALKVAQVFGAAQALISAYQGAAEALKLPFPQNIAAAATVLAKGIGFVTAIKGVNASSGAAGGGGGGGGGAASAPVAQQQQPNVQTLNFSVVNDPFGFSDKVVRQIVGAINEAQRNGNNLIRATVT